MVASVTLKGREKEKGEPKLSFGRDEATRTPDPYVPNVVRYQLRYIPMTPLLSPPRGEDLVLAHWMEWGFFCGETGIAFVALNPVYLLAERRGFEPRNRFGRLHAFQACLFSHSSISPNRSAKVRIIYQTNIYKLYFFAISRNNFVSDHKIQTF